MRYGDVHTGDMTTQTSIPTESLRYSAPLSPARAAAKRRHLTVMVANEAARLEAFAAAGLSMDQHSLDTHHRRLMALDALGGPLA